MRYEALFLDFDPEHGIPPGRCWRQTLYSQLRLSRAVIVVCSPAYCASQWCLAELAIAIDRGKLVLPVRLDPRDDLRDVPRLLLDIQATRLAPIALGPGLETGWDGLERGLEPDNLAVLAVLSAWDRATLKLALGQIGHLQQRLAAEILNAV